MCLIWVLIDELIKLNIMDIIFATWLTTGESMEHIKNVQFGYFVLCTQWICWKLTQQCAKLQNLGEVVIIIVIVFVEGQ